MAKDNRKPINPYPDHGEAFPFWGSPVYVADDATSKYFEVQPGELYCPGFTGSTYAKSVQDKVYIEVPFSGQSQPFTPGIITGIEVDKKLAIDKKKAAGADGHRITAHGIDPADVEIRILIWTPEQYRQWRILWEVIGPRVTKKTTVTRTPITTQVVLFDRNQDRAATGGNISIPTGKYVSKKNTKSTVEKQAFDVQHPTLDDHGIKSLLFVQATGPTPTGNGRQRAITMKAVEFMNPGNVNATKTTNASTAKGSLLDPGAQQTPGTDTHNWRPPT